jgi:two-component system phosphate regulon sensor histidine kinase PhoR
MQSLVNDLLILSKLEGSPAPLIDAWIDVDQLLGSCAREAKALQVELYSENTADSKHRQQSQSIEFEVQSGIELAGSQAELLSAMCNLANNAVRYTPLGGTIRVSFQMLDRGGAIFSVNDSGLGIAPEHLPRLTERFYRVDTSRSRDSGGTGLGLAIVKHVVQRHGGELKIASSLGQGSTFCFTLPEYRARYKNLEL